MIIMYVYIYTYCYIHIIYTYYIMYVVTHVDFCFVWTSKVSVTGKTVQLVLETTVDEALAAPQRLDDTMKLHETWSFNQP